LADAPTLAGLLRKHGQQLAPDRLDLLVQFHALLVEKNRKLNLTRIRNLEDIVLKHYVDCFLVARFVPQLPSPLLDIGTGGGFPGIPLKILFPDTQVILAEGVRKRVEFLREVRESLGLENLDIVGRNIDRDFEYPVNGIITRAVEPIRDTLRRVSNCLVPGGIAIFMKGPNVDGEKVDAAGKFPELYTEVEDHRYTLPSSPFRRSLVVYRKNRRPAGEEKEE